MTAIQKIGVLTSKANKWMRLEEEETKLEYCQNPWTPDCGSTDTELYIVHDGEKIPIC